MPRPQNRSSKPSPAKAAANARARWFEITNLAEAGTAEIKLRGYIGAPKNYYDWWSGGTVEDPDAAGTLQEFEQELEALGEVANLQLSIFSQGGDWMTGVAIHNLLVRHPANKVCIVDGLCASAATYPALACQEIRIPTNAAMFIHEAEGCECGSAADLRAYADSLDQISNNIAELYASRTGKSVEEIRNLMAEERYLFGQECVDLGLADKVIEPVSNLATRAGSLTPTNHRSLNHAPAEILALFDMRGMANLHRTQPNSTTTTMRPWMPLFNKATDPATGGGATTTPAAAPAGTPAAAPAAPAAPATPPPPTNVITLADVTNAVTAAIKPLEDKITAQETEIKNLKEAGLKALPGGAPVNNALNPPAEGQPAAPTNEAELKDALKKAKNHAERREILNAYDARKK